MIEFAREAYDDVVRHADAGGAEEICGVLAGTRGDGDEAGFEQETVSVSSER
jgi:proteasome lid subunit RPN8/RPN11